MLSEELLNFITTGQTANKVSLRKLDNGFKMIADALNYLNTDIAESVPKLFLKKDISTIEQYAKMSSLIESELELICNSSRKICLIIDSRTNTAYKEIDEVEIPISNLLELKL